MAEYLLENGAELEGNSRRTEHDPCALNLLVPNRSELLYFSFINYLQPHS